MALSPLGARALILVAAFGLICATGAAGASRDADGAAKGGPRGASAGFVNTLCPSCKPPRRYRFTAGGTTKYRYGGTETWSMRGKLLHRPSGISPGTSKLDADYWQTGGKVTLTFHNIGFENVFDCTGMNSGYPIAIFNAPTQTIPLRHFESDFVIVFSMDDHPSYLISTGPPGHFQGAAHGTLKCNDEIGKTTPLALQHLWTGDLTQRGKPKRVVKGSYEYTDVELYHYRFHWELTAIKPRH